MNKVTFQPASGEAATLAEDAARKTFLLEGFDMQGQFQEVPLVRSDAPFQKPRQNVAGLMSFTAAFSHATHDAASTYLFNELARVNQQGTLTWQRDDVTLTMAGATLLGITIAKLDGVLLILRYRFRFTSITTA